MCSIVFRWRASVFIEIVFWHNQILFYFDEWGSYLFLLLELARKTCKIDGKIKIGTTTTTKKSPAQQYKNANRTMRQQQQWIHTLAHIWEDKWNHMQRNKEIKKVVRTSGNRCMKQLVLIYALLTLFHKYGAPLPSFEKRKLKQCSEVERERRRRKCRTRSFTPMLETCLRSSKLYIYF